MFRTKIKKMISEAITKAFPEAEVPDFSVIASEHAEHGDFASNAGLLLAKNLKKPLQEIAEAVAKRVEGGGWRVEVKKPGFLNFFIPNSLLIEKLNEVFENTESFGTFDFWKGKKVMIEFTDPNPFKEFHIGHLYSNIAGESLARMFEACGAHVARANYQGDVGMHVAKAIWGMKKKMQEDGETLEELAREPLKKRIQFMGQAYAEGAKAFEEDKNAAAEIADLNKKIFAHDFDITELYEKGRQWSLEYFEEIYKRLGTKFNFYYFESEVGGRGLALVKEYAKKGVFEESEGATVFPGEKYGLHRRVFVNSAGLPTYEAKELGLAPKKYEDFPYDISFIVTGGEIVEYFKVLRAALKEVNPNLAEKTKHIPHGMVMLAHGKMSSRTGDVIRAEDLLDEVSGRVQTIMDSSEERVTHGEKALLQEKIALAAVKYSFLKIHLGKDISFDIDASLNLEGESGPYLQYTYARLKSILRKLNSPLLFPTPDRGAGSERESRKPDPRLHGDDNKGEAETTEQEQEMTKLEHELLFSALRFSEIVEDALKNVMPNMLAHYLHELARLANEFYHSHPVLHESDEKKREFRVGLVFVIALTLQKGMYLLGIEALEKM